MKNGDVDWKHGRAPLFVFRADNPTYEIGRAGFFEFFGENALGAGRAFPSVKRMETEVVDIALADVRVPAEAILPGAAGLGAPFSCLNEARYGIIWGAMGAARDAYEAALAYALGRRQFGKPIASFQLTQEKLVDMVLEIQKGLLVALHIGRMKDAGTLIPEQISFGKLNNVRTAIAIARQARTILGGNGVALEYSPMRHASNLEGVRTYEGTDEVHTLIMGRAITGISAFS